MGRRHDLHQSRELPAIKPGLNYGWFQYSGQIGCAAHSGLLQAIVRGAQYATI